MPEYVEVSNQAELDKALERPNVVPVLIGNGRFVFWGSSSPSIEAWGSSSPSIVAWESSSPSIVAWESSSPSIVARGSSSPSIVVAATAAAVLRAWGTKKLKPVVVEGGRLVELAKPDISTAEKWCAYHGVTVEDDVATLYKALDDKFCAHYNHFPYTPGTEPQAPDWDGGAVECGGGLHFSPTPGHARGFFPEAKRYVACPVRLADIITSPDGMYPAKVKAPGVCGPVYEVDRHGERVEPVEATA